MPRFRQTVNANYTIDVEAKDMYEADEIISSMSSDEFFARAKLSELYNYDTDEYSEEI